MCCLGAAKKEAANPGPPPGLKPPQRFDLFTPQKKPESQPGVEIAQWCDKHGVPEAVDALTYNGLRAIAEVAVLSDAQVDALRQHGITDKGIVQLTHIVSDFSSYNTLNLALDTDYDYRDFWKELAGFTASN